MHFYPFFWQIFSQELYEFIEKLPESVWHLVYNDVTQFKLFPFIESYKSECHPCVYRELNEAYRYWSYMNHTYLGCDRDTLENGQWYRFTGDAGAMMATYCIPHLSCNAHMAGWINGSLPLLFSIPVSSTVCFHWNQNCCYISYRAEIMKCWGFYVYKLQKPSDSRARHCGVKCKSCSSIIIFFGSN